jgi:hypothetical protein
MFDACLARLRSGRPGSAHGMNTIHRNPRLWLVVALVVAAVIVVLLVTAGGGGGGHGAGGGGGY